MQRITSTLTGFVSMGITFTGIKLIIHNKPKVMTNGNDLAFPFQFTPLQYACIHLCVPESGEDWLDELIRKRQRNDLITATMQGLCSNTGFNGRTYDDISEMVILRIRSLITELNK